MPTIEPNDLTVIRQDCQAILWHLSKERSLHRRIFLLADLLSKGEVLPPTEGLRWQNLGLRAILGMISEEETLTMATAIRSPLIAFLTPKPRELRGALGVFGLSAAVNEPSRRHKGFRYWEVEHDACRVVITMAGEERGFAISAAVRALAQSYRPEVIVLCGVAAGIREKVLLGDVVVAERVVDYEGGVKRTSGILPRPEFLELRDDLAREVAYFEARTGGRVEDCARTIRTSTEGHTEVDSALAGLSPRVMGGSILSGEKVLQDGVSMDHLRAALDDRARAVDQESWAFAKACEEETIRWLVFRGVSDFGDEASMEHGAQSASSRDFQTVAAMCATVCGLAFIENVYLQA